MAPLSFVVLLLAACQAWAGSEDAAVVLLQRRADILERAGPSFAVGANGTAQCPEGYRTIVNQHVCRQANDTLLGLGPWRHKGSWPLLPRGCFRDIAGEVYLNSNASGAGKEGHTPICEKADSSFAAGSEGKANCPPGYQNIDNERACRQAKNVLGMGLWRRQGSWPLYPGGCFIDPSGDIFLNQNSSGASKIGHAPLCARAIPTRSHEAAVYAVEAVKLAAVPPVVDLDSLEGLFNLSDDPQSQVGAVDSAALSDPLAQMAADIAEAHRSAVVSSGGDSLGSRGVAPGLGAAEVYVAAAPTARSYADAPPHVQPMLVPAVSGSEMGSIEEREREIIAASSRAMPVAPSYTYAVPEAVREVAPTAPTYADAAPQVQPLSAIPAAPVYAYASPQVQPMSVSAVSGTEMESIEERERQLTSAGAASQVQASVNGITGPAAPADIAPQSAVAADESLAVDFTPNFAVPVQDVEPETFTLTDPPRGFIRGPLDGNDAAAVTGSVAQAAPVDAAPAAPAGPRLTPSGATWQP